MVYRFRVTWTSAFYCAGDKLFLNVYWNSMGDKLCFLTFKSCNLLWEWCVVYVFLIGTSALPRITRSRTKCTLVAPTGITFRPTIRLFEINCSTSRSTIYRFTLQITRFQCNYWWDSHNRQFECPASLLVDLISFWIGSSTQKVLQLSQIYVKHFLFFQKQNNHNELSLLLNPWKTYKTKKE